jgi:RNA polymerase sigma-70 factor (ECF subfamily)
LFAPPVYTIWEMGREEPALKSRGKEPGERLLIEAAQKDPRRFGELYENNFDRVYAFIARRVLDRSQAQDLTSDVFHKALANLGRFEWRGAPFAAWLFQIAANAIADHFQRMARERKIPDADPPREDPQKANPEGVEHRASLFRLVRQLPTDQRRVIQMRFAEEMTIGEIARGLGRSEGAVKQLQFRALQHLRAQMRDANA